MKFSNDITYKINRFEDLTSTEAFELLKLRSKVFVEEQICVYLDPDKNDLGSDHVRGLSKSGELLTYCRIYKSECWHIGRIVTKNSARGGGLGAQMVVESIKYCHSKQSSLSIEMSAQVYLTDFYKNLGFTPQGGMYLEDGIPHIKMSYQNNL